MSATPPTPPGAPPPPFPPEMEEAFRKALLDQLARLERSMRTSADATRPVELDQQAVGRLSRMDALQNQQLSRNLKEREEARYAAVRAALGRLADGSFGRCTECGAGIAPGRLLVMPEEPRCGGCGG